MRFPKSPMAKRKPQDEGCKIEVKRTKNGKKVVIGRGCTKEQLQMLKESGELNLNESSDY